MKKHIFMAAVFVSCLLLLVACGKQADRDNLSDGGTEPSQAAASSAAPSESGKSNMDYAKYSGAWVNSAIKGTDPQKGGTYMDLQVDASGQVSGNISTASNNMGHIAQIDFNGQIVNGKMEFDFKNDGWDHAGTVTLDFQGEEIDADITINSNQSSLWSVQAGKITFVQK